MFGLMLRDPAARLRMLMSEKDVNVQELADMTGLSPGTITRLRTGRVANPHNDTMYEIARSLGVKPNDIWPDV